MKRLLVPFLFVAEIIALILAVLIETATGINCGGIVVKIDEWGTWASGRK